MIYNVLRLIAIKKKLNYKNNIIKIIIHNQ